MTWSRSVCLILSAPLLTAVIWTDGCREKRSLEAHVAAERHSCLVHLLTAFDGALDVNQLIIPEALPAPEQAITITAAALTNVAFSYRGGYVSSSSNVGTNLTDNGNLPLGLLLLFTGFETNSDGRHVPLIQVISYAPSSRQNLFATEIWSMSVTQTMLVPHWHPGVAKGIVLDAVPLK
jgi:hypothetical protein